MHTKNFIATALILTTIASTECSAATGKTQAAAKAPSAPALRVENDDLYRPDLYPLASSAAPSATTATPIPPPKAPMEAVDPAMQVRAWTTGSEWLSDSLKAWGKSVNWEVRWAPKDKTTDRHLDRPLHFNGTFRQAIDNAVSLYRNSPDPLFIDVYEDQRLIFITEAK